MTIRTHTNIHGKCAPGKVFYDKRFDLAWKIAKEQDISKLAQNRLKWIDHYSKTKNAALTCRYFGVSESCFWKWEKRYQENGLIALESKSKKPKKFRKSKIPSEIIVEIQKLRKLYPNYGKEKIFILMNEKISVSSIGRIIRKYNMFYRAKKKLRGYGWKWGKRQRIKNLIWKGQPGEHIQMDTVVLYRNSKVYYIKTAIDTVTKIAFAYAYHKNSSMITVNFLKKLQYVLPYSVKNIHTDNGSEFLGYFHEELEKEQIKHYFSYPNCPKQHGCVERFNGILRREFLEEGNLFYNFETLNKKLINWLIEYNFHRPHTSLDYRTPLGFFEENFVQSVHQKSSTQPSSMYWTHTQI